MKQLSLLSKDDYTDREALYRQENKSFDHLLKEAQLESQVMVMRARKLWPELQFEKLYELPKLEYGFVCEWFNLQWNPRFLYIHGGEYDDYLSRVRGSDSKASVRPYRPQPVYRKIQDHSRRMHLTVRKRFGLQDKIWMPESGKRRAGYFVSDRGADYLGTGAMLPYYRDEYFAALQAHVLRNPLYWGACPLPSEQVCQIQPGLFHKSESVEREIKLRSQGK